MLTTGWSSARRAAAFLGGVALGAVVRPHGHAGEARYTGREPVPIVASARAGSTVLGAWAPHAALVSRACGGCRAQRYLPVAPEGFVDARSLVAEAPPAAFPTRAARVRRHTPVLGRPERGARVLHHLRTAFVVEVGEASGGFARRPEAGFVRERDLERLVPSALRGVRAPPPVLGFVLEDVRARDGPLRRYDARPVRAFDEHGVELDVGPLPRDKVRVARARTRPASVPREDRWVHVDLSEQVLTAYEGDRLVFATLVRSGGYGHPTARGVFRVHEKARDATMYGDERSYLVERVRNVLFFHHGFALHGAHWHDRFGRRGSHGCVNLSPSDAEFLFDFAPPALPDGWHALRPRAARRASLHVWVE